MADPPYFGRNWENVDLNHYHDGLYLVSLGSVTSIEYTLLTWIHCHREFYP